MKQKHALRQRMLAVLPQFVLGCAFIFFMLAVYCFQQWSVAEQLNAAVADRSLVAQKPGQDNPLKAYSIGYLLYKQNRPEAALKAFEVAEAAEDNYLRALTKYALGNLHLDAVEANLAKERGSRRIVAQVLLAREAYKSALRLVPDLYAARFNLERLDRISPEKRGKGRTMDEGYTIGLDPFKQNGRALMKDNTRRGLP